MLNAEEARARLEAIADPDWRAKAKKRSRKLPWRLRPFAGTLIEPDPVFTTQAVADAQRKLLDALARQLDKLPSKDRAELMAAVHPGLGRALARWWVDAIGQPYSVGWMRKAFRAPHNPDLTRQTRITTFRAMLEAVGPYTGDAVWLAAWAPYIPSGQWGATFGNASAGLLLAAAIDEGGAEGDAVFEALTATGRGDHPIAMMGRHVIVGLLRSARPDGWDFVERLLLAAQRQEGLRQSILEAADEGHPEAFDRLIAVIIELDLLRFAATVRAVGVWLGFAADVQEIPEAKRRLEEFRRFRTDPAAARAAAGAATASQDGWEAYAALCAIATIDVAEAMGLAEKVVTDDTRPVHGRAAAIRFAGLTQLAGATSLAWRVLDDADVRVAWLAFEIVRYDNSAESPADGFERLERLARRLPDTDRSFEPVGVEGTPVKVERSAVIASLLRARGRRPLSDLLPWVAWMDPWTRQSLATAIGEMGPRLTPDLRATVVAMVGDRSASVRQAAVVAMGKLRVHPSEAPSLEGLLTRKASDLRRGVLGLLAAMPEQEAIRSAERLWDGDTAQRDAACELLRLFKERPAAVAVARRLAGSPSLSARQSELLGDITGTPSPAAVHADDPGLGLYRPDGRAAIHPPTAPRRRSFVSETAARIISAVDDLAETHRDTPLLIATWQGSRETLLSDAPWLPSPFHRLPGVDAEQEGAGLILADVFRPWWDGRGRELRESAPDLDALRALTASATAQTLRYLAGYRHNQQQQWYTQLLKQVGGAPVGELRHPAVAGHVLSWMLVEQATPATVDECLDAIAATAAAVPGSAVRNLGRTGEPSYRWDSDFRHLLHNHPWMNVLEGLHRRRPELFGTEQIGRWFQLARWFDEPKPGVDRRPVDTQLALRAFELGIATEHDILDLFLVDRSQVLQTMTRHRRADLAAQHPQVVALADRLRERILDIELARGELATPASGVAFRLGSIAGSQLVARLLAGLGRGTIVRGYIGLNEGREAVYSHLLRVSHPAPQESATTLRDAATAAGVTDQRLLELAVFAPQWATRVEEALSWPGLADAVWWFHAHTKDDQWSVAEEVRETWAALSAERTPLLSEDLVAGAVDVAWFHRSRAALGEARWKKLHALAKLTSGGNGHRRAQLFAEAMSGDTAEAPLVERIRTKRHQDSVRALGLLPLPEDAADRQAIMLHRYGVLREFERGRPSSAPSARPTRRPRCASASRTWPAAAGMVDPQRFVWAMEAAEAGPLADGPVRVTIADEDLTVVLSVEAEGVPAVRAERKGRALKAVPPKAKKDPDVADLLARKTSLTRQASRVRASLEAAMVNQEPFATEDLAGLDRHPVVAPMLRLVVFVDRARRSGAPCRRRPLRRRRRNARVTRRGAAPCPSRRPAGEWTMDRLAEPAVRRREASTVQAGVPRAVHAHRDRAGGRPRQPSLRGTPGAAPSGARPPRPARVVDRPREWRGGPRVPRLRAGRSPGVPERVPDARRRGAADDQRRDVHQAGRLAARAARLRPARRLLGDDARPRPRRQRRPRRRRGPRGVALHGGNAGCARAGDDPGHATGQRPAGELARGNRGRPG